MEIPLPDLNSVTYGTYLRDATLDSNFSFPSDNKRGEDFAFLPSLLRLMKQN
jgi:hypothetical protein